MTDKRTTAQQWLDELLHELTELGIQRAEQPRKTARFEQVRRGFEVGKAEAKKKENAS